MFKILTLNDAAVRKLRREHPILKGKKLIASGQYSGVFEGTTPETVLKLTIDAPSYVFHSLYMRSHGLPKKHFTQVVADYGVVGEFVIAKNIPVTAITKPTNLCVPIYLYECERLEKLPTKTDNSKLVMKISTLVKQAMFAAEYTTQAQRGVDVIEVLMKASFVPDSLRHDLIVLRDFFKETNDVFIDIHRANFMQRSNGELVLSDPIGCHKVMKACEGGFKPSSPSSPQ